MGNVPVMPIVPIYIDGPYNPQRGVSPAQASVQSATKTVERKLNEKQLTQQIVDQWKAAQLAVTDQKDGDAAVNTKQQFRPRNASKEVKPIDATLDGYAFTVEQIAALMPIYSWYYGDRDGPWFVSHSDTLHFQYGWRIGNNGQPIGFVYNKSVKDSQPVYRLSRHEACYKMFGSDVTPDNFDANGYRNEGIAWWQPVAGPVRDWRLADQSRYNLHLKVF